MGSVTQMIHVRGSSFQIYFCLIREKRNQPEQDLVQIFGLFSVRNRGVFAFFSFKHIHDLA